MANQNENEKMDYASGSPEPETVITSTGDKEMHRKE